VSKKHWLVFIIVTCLGVVLGIGDRFFYVGFNTSESLPYHLFIVIKGQEIHKGDYAAFVAPNNKRFKPTTYFVKQAAGVEGDNVSERSGIFFINNQPIGKCLKKDAKGRILTPGMTGNIPKDTYFMVGDHERSFDSRYAQMGWIPKDQLIGRAYPLF
jgi:conjugal transfer pilin signal peptidase TrbI